MNSAIHDDLRTPQAGAEAAPRLDEVFVEHADFVWRVLQRLAVEESDLDDALQEVFLIVARKIEGYAEGGSMRAWLFTIARQVAMHFRRGEARRRRRRQAFSEAPAPRPSDPERALELRQAAERVERALGELEPRQGMAVYLADIEGLTAPEIANALSVNLNTIYARIRLGRRRFRALLHATLDENGGTS